MRGLQPHCSVNCEDASQCTVAAVLVGRKALVLSSYRSGWSSPRLDACTYVAVVAVVWLMRDDKRRGSATSEHVNALTAVAVLVVQDVGDRLSGYLRKRTPGTALHIGTDRRSLERLIDAK
jgi:hypothetical protein